MRKHLALTCFSMVTLLGCQEASPPFAVGTLERHRIELRAERQEPILELAVREGDRVEAGDLIVVLDSRRVAAQFGQARATGDLSAAKLAEVVRGARAEEIERARADLGEAEAALIELRPEVARIERLVDEGIEAQTALESVQAAIAAARARRSALQAALERLLNGATVEELDQAGPSMRCRSKSGMSLELERRSRSCLPTRPLLRVSMFQPNCGPASRLGKPCPSRSMVFQIHSQVKCG
jgi:HlyD family secretion protein